MKILSPAGNFESLVSAVINGADEVYLGINEFNARNNVIGFNLNDLCSAVDFAHVYGVKVCLAVNILFNDYELEKAVDVVLSAYEMGVDYFIVQDIGLISILSKNYPEIILHASTQMGVHNLEGVKYLEQFGIKRVVLARETPIEEIKRIRKNSNVEIEYFVQGALCVSFSGNCYLSSYLLNASGNRGRCKQLCRLPYKLLFKDKLIKKGYLLSAKDFCLIDRLGELKSAGVDVIKIEGRARRPAYVGAVTKQYYNALNGKNVDFNEIKLAFNREYTAGYFDGNKDIISEYNNHIGIKIGKVSKVVNGKNFNQVYFTSERDLVKKSTFKLFYNGQEDCTISAFDLTKKDGKTYCLTTTSAVKVNSNVHLILDPSSENSVLNTKKKVDIDISLNAKVNKRICATYSVFGKEKVIFGSVLEPALSNSLSNKEISECFSKSEYFNANITIEQLDNVFIAKSKLNEFRRETFENIKLDIISHYKKLIEKKDLRFDRISSENRLTDFEVIYDYQKTATAQNVILSPEVYDVNKIKAYIDKCNSKGLKVYLDTPNFALEKDIELLKKIIEQTSVAIVVNNYYAMQFDTEKVIGGFMNVYNSASEKVFNAKTIRAEGEEGVIKMPYMTLRHCPIKQHVGGDCKSCAYKDGYTFVLDSGKKLKLKRKKLNTCTFYIVD